MSPTPQEPNPQAELLAGVLDSSLDGVMAFRALRDDAGQIVDFIFEIANKRSEQIVGHKASDMLGNKLLDFFPGNVEDGLFAAYCKVVETGEPFETTHHYHHDGLNHWFSIKAAKWSDGFTVTFSDITSRKADEEKFRVLFECSTNAHLLFDESGIISCNQAAIDLLAYDSKEELLQIHPAALSPEYQPDGRRSLEKCIEMDRIAHEQGYHRFDWMHRRKDGSDILVEVTLNPVKLSGKDVLLVVWHDLSERIEAEKTVRKAVDSLSEAQQLANIGNWQWTVADNKIIWSDQIKRMFAVPLDQPAPSFEEHCKQIHPDDRAYWQSVLDKAAEDHQPYFMKFRIILPSGEVRVLESRGRCELDQTGQLVRTYGTVQDITEAEATQRQLEKLSLVASRTDNSVVLMDSAGLITWVNPAFSTLSGYSESEVIGLHPPDLFQGPKTNQETIRRIKQNLQQGTAFSETILKYRKDKSTYWSEIEVQPILDDRGEITRFMAIERDVTDRIKQQEELDAQRHRLEFSLQSSRTGLWDWFIETGEAYFSDTWYTMLGYEPGEMPMTFETWESLSHPDDLPEAKALLAAYFEGQSADYSCEMRMRNKAGDWQWVKTFGRAAERDQDNRIKRIIGLHIDIDEQKRVQEEIQAQQRQLAFALSASRSGLWDWHVATGETYFSDTWYTMLGYEPGELPMDVQSWIDLSHPDDLKRAMQAVEAYFNGETERYECTMRMRHKTGGWHWIRDVGEAIERDASGKVTRMVGLHVDIHQQKRAELEIAAQQKRLEFALKSSNTGLWDWDIQSGESQLSETWYTMLGYAPDQLPQGIERVQDLAHPEDRAEAIERTRAYLAGEISSFAGEMRYQNSEGQWQWVKDVGEAIEFDAQGQPTRMVGLNLDIDAQKRAQAKLEHARDLAEQASAAKSAFVANMSHEIRTPMNAILGYADLLLESNQSAADKRNHAQTIIRNGKHLMNLLNDVLDISKIEAGKMSIEQIDCDPEAIFSDSISLLVPRAEEKGLALDLELEQPLPKRIATDPTRMRQVLLNLLGNAIKFTQTGSVRLRVRHEANSDQGYTLTCDVIDSGIGITAKQADRLFQAFNQADASTTRQFGGTGLGLAISKNLCQLLGGELTYESTPGEGSIFTASFQVGRAKEPKQVQSTTPKTDPAAHSLKGKRILVVEDGVDNQRLIQHYLVKAGAEVEIAENGAVGRDLALQAFDTDHAFDIILMDMQMPVLDGYSATRELREANYELPIIALTAHASMNDRAVCIDAGCDDYLTKPIDRTKLFRTLLAYLGENAST